MIQCQHLFTRLGRGRWIIALKIQRATPYAHLALAAMTTGIVPHPSIIGSHVGSHENLVCCEKGIATLRSGGSRCRTFASTYLCVIVGAGRGITWSVVGSVSRASACRSGDRQESTLRTRSGRLRRNSVAVRVCIAIGAFLHPRSVSFSWDENAPHPACISQVGACHLLSKLNAGIPHGQSARGNVLPASLSINIDMTMVQVWMLLL